MEALEPIKLKRFFSLFEPIYVLGTTFSLSLAFFESVVLPLFRDRLQGCVILTDRLGFSRAIQEAGALLEATRSYCVATAPCEGAFHSKVWILVNDQRAALLVGSGNLTQSGMVGNLEAFEAMEIVGPDCPPGICAQVLSFLEEIEGLWAEDQKEHLPALRILAALKSELKKVAGDISPVATETFFLSSFGGSFPDQLLTRVGKVSSMHVASPYFGASIKGLRLLTDTLKPEKVSVYPAIHPDGGIDIPLSEAIAMPGVEVRALPWISADERFAHLKLLGFAGADGSYWLFTGSVNATASALDGKNIEAGVLRRVGQDVWRSLWSKGAVLPDTPLAKITYQGQSLERSLLFQATNSGDGLDLTLIEFADKDLPLGDVEFIWSSGISRRTARRDLIFTNGPFWRVPIGEFSEATEQPGRCGLLTLKATTTRGVKVEGVAFVDDVESLLSSPLQRRAFGSILDLLNSEGLPDWTSAAALFGMIEGLFADGDDDPQSPATTTRGTSGKPATDPLVDPLWPAVPAGIQLMPIVHQGISRKIAWLDRISSLFASREREGSSVRRPGKEADDASDEELDELGESADSPTDARKQKEIKEYWDFVTEWRNHWSERERNAELNPQLAAKLLSVSFVLARWTLLVRLKFRGEASASNVTMPSAQELARDFLHRMFDDRQQDDEIVPKLAHYSMWAFPALLPDAVDRCSWQIPETDRILIVGMFGLLQARSRMLKENTFPVHWWLVWQRICPTDENWLSENHVTLGGLFKHTVLDEDESLPNDVLEDALLDLLLIKWDDLPGYQRLRLLKSDPTCPLLDGMTEINALRTMLKRGRDESLFHRAKPGTRSCPNRSCRATGQTQAEIRDSIRHLSPVVCPRCYSVAVPALLYDVCAPF